MIGEGPHDGAVIVAVIRPAVGLDDGPVGQVGKDGVRRIRNAVFALCARAATQWDIAAAQNGMAAHIVVGFDNNHRRPRIRGPDLAAGGPVAPAPMIATSAFQVPARRHRADAEQVLRFVPPVAALGSETVNSTVTSRPGPGPIAPLLDALRAWAWTSTATACRSRCAATGSVAGGTVEIDASASSQFVSGLLLSGRGVHRRTDDRAHRRVGAVGAAHRDDGVDAARRPASTSTTRRPTDGGSRPARSRRGTGSSSPTCPTPCRSWPPPWSAAGPCGSRAGRRSASSPPMRSCAILEKLGSAVRHSSSYLEVQGADDLRRLRRRPARRRRADPGGGRAGRAGRAGFGVAAARDRASARA